MSIYVTGDIHANIDIGKLSNKKFKEQKGMTKDDYLIICGDFGLVWDGSREELFWRKWLEYKPFTTLFIDGNHENFDMLNAYPISAWNGGKVHFISNHVIHLMRGQVFNLQGKKFFTMGGASSYDKEYRVEGKSWWEDEIPSLSEMGEGYENLRKNNWCVDYIITHCGPSKLVHKYLFDNYNDDASTLYLEFVSKDVKFKEWFMGHYHIDMDVMMNNNQYHILYDTIMKIL